MSTAAPPDRTTARRRVAFVGLGRMGRELVAHVLDAGHDVTVWNRTSARAKVAAERGAKCANTLAEAVADAEVVISVLFGPDTVRTVLLADAMLRLGQLWIDITTVAPADAAEFTGWAVEHGVRYVHAPVVGSLGPARSRALGTLLGGAPADVEEATTLTTLWGAERVRRFESPAQAAAAKLVANLAVAVTIQGLVEALRLGRGGGLTTDEVLAVLDGTPLAPIVAVKGHTIRSNVFDDTQFAADALAKDVRLMLDTSLSPLPAVGAALGSLSSAQAAGLGGHDFSVIARRRQG